MPSPFPGMDPYLVDPSVWMDFHDLAELVATTYKRGRYDRSLPYSLPPAAPLAADDLQWAAALGQSLAR